jgi:rhamnosyltransferase
MNDSQVNPKVAVLLATYNGEQWLAEQLDSIFRSEGVETHVFASDDGSCDKTLDILGSYVEADLTLLLPQSSGGAGQNFIRLILEAEFDASDYVALSDQDDVWLPQKLKRAIAEISSQELDGYSSDVVAFWEGGRREYLQKSYPQKKLDYLFESGGPGNTFVLPLRSALLLRDFLKSLPFEDLKAIALHDWLIYAFFRKNAYKWQIDRYAGLLYRQHAANVLGTGNGLQAALKRIKLLRKGWYKNQILLLAKILNLDDPIVGFISKPNLAGLPKALVRIYEYRRKFRDCIGLAAVLVWLAVSRN